MKVVYGARCTWWDTIDKAGRTSVPDDPILRSNHILPACPHCGSVLYEIPDEAKWQSSIDTYENQGHPGYADMMAWARGRCFPNLTALREAYESRD